MAEPFLGEIKLVPYNFAPHGWAFCAGQLLSIQQNTALFALLGTIYGGNGQTNFALPDLRGRAALHHGQGPGLSNYDQGETLGVESVTLTAGQLPAHAHLVGVGTALGSVGSPVGEHLATSPFGLGFAYDATPSGSKMPSGTIRDAGGGQPHENRQPFLGLNYVIALQGIFPSR